MVSCTLDFGLTPVPSDNPSAMALYATKRRKLSHSTDSDSENNDSARNNDLTTSGNVDVSVDKEKRNIGTRIGGAASIKASQEGFGHFASSAYNSNTFKLQMDELLVKARPKYEKRMVKVENALRKLKGIIENIPSREALSVCYGDCLRRDFLPNS